MDRSDRSLDGLLYAMIDLPFGDESRDSLDHLFEIVFHASGEVSIDQILELILQQLCHAESSEGRRQLVTFLKSVTAILDLRHHGEARELDLTILEEGLT